MPADMEVIGERTLHEQKWTVLKEKTYRDQSGRQGSWTYIERRCGQEAVVIVALTAQSGSLVVIEQFRVPLERTVAEFPAGLVDSGESPEAAARRELREETGFEGEILEVGPAVATTAGLSTETVRMVFMQVAEQPAGEAAPEGAERITVRVLAPSDFEAFLAECRHRKLILDAKLYLYLRQRSEALSGEQAPKE